MKRLNHFIVKENQILVFGLIESGVFDIADQVVRDLMPHSSLELSQIGELTSLYTAN